MNERVVASAVFFMLAPGTMAGLIPYLITHWRIGAAPWWTHALGVVLILGGLVFLIECFARFVRDGLGTAAPLMPTQRLVVTGLYAYVRNPMYVSVLALILGQALLFANAALIAYGVFSFIVVTIFVVYFEEQRLAHVFAEDWPAYSANVGRWLPRLSPWKPIAKQEIAP